MKSKSKKPAAKKPARRAAAPKTPARQATVRKAPAGSTAKRRVPVPQHPKQLEDNPMRRYQELMEDRHYGQPPEANLAEKRLQALSQAKRMLPSHEGAMTPATPGNSNWVPLGPLAIPNGQTYGGARVIVTGRINAIVPDPFDPAVLYVAAARGGIWKSTDSGVTWQPKSDNEVSLAIGALAISQSNPQVLYAGTGEGNIYYYAKNFTLDSVNASYNGTGILKSNDGGNTWTAQATATFTGACFYKIAVHPTDPDTAFAVSSLGLHRTTNGGANWNLLSSGLPPITAAVIAATDVAIDPATPATVYVAFWGSGIYKTTNAAVANPTFTKLAGGLPTTNLSRISLAVAPTSPLSVYSLIADAADGLRGFFASSDGGANWTTVAAAAVQVYGAYTGNVAVDVSTPDVVYLSGVSLYKAVRTGGVWSVTEIGANIHPDNHAFGCHPTNHLIVYAGNDGGIYKSSDAGATWDDTINEGICITQFEFIDQHPTSDAILIGGTQDNGTEQFRNSPAFYHSADGDGGSAGIDQTSPRNVIHTYYGSSPERSTQGGNFGTYSNISTGLTGAVLFYAPMAYDQTNSQNIAFGTDRINLDTAQGTGSWPTKVTLPGIAGRVSAIWYPNSNLIFAGTSSGQVYRLSKSGATWTVNQISAAPLVARWIWGLATRPGDLNTVLVGVSGFGTPHVWRGVVAGSGATAVWTDISGTAPHRVPDVPINALAVDPANPNTCFVGTDVGVYRTTDSGANWALFSDGLPNVAVYDLVLHSTARLLRAGTHGRGLWERKLDTASSPNVNIYVRDHLMETARALPSVSPVTATYSDPLQQVTIGDSLWWWMCADIKVDSPSAGSHTFQMPVAAVDYLAFETRLTHRNPQRGATNRVYVQVHNRGIQPAANVTVKVLYADATPGLPNLPADFWTAFPGNGDTTFWKPVGAAQVISSVSPSRPEILEWDWVPPATAAQHSCMLVVCECAADPIPAANKVFDIATLVTNEKRVGLKNLHVIDALAPIWSMVRFRNVLSSDIFRWVGPPPPGWSIGMLLPKEIDRAAKFTGLAAAKLTAAQTTDLKKTVGDRLKDYDATAFKALGAQAKESAITNLPKSQSIDVLLKFTAGTRSLPASVTLVQEREGRVIGGNTFILQPKPS